MNSYDPQKPFDGFDFKLESPRYRYYNTGGVKEITFYNDKNIIHRPECDGPANFYYHQNGAKYLEEYVVDGKSHRSNGPAKTAWEKNGVKVYEAYVRDGRDHRVDGPSITEWSSNGTLLREEYHINGERIYANSFREFKKILTRRLFI